MSGVVKDGISTHDENMQYLNLAMKAYVTKMSLNSEDRGRNAEQPSRSALNRDSGGHLKTPEHITEHMTSFSLPFGPHLIPVTCHADLYQKPSVTNPTDALTAKDDALLCTRKTTKPRHTETRGKEKAVGASEEGGNGGAMCGRISTNAMLDCLLHPDVIALVTKLMIDRQKEPD